MSLTDLVATAVHKQNFITLTDYVTFCLRYLDFAAHGLQAVIVSQNEPNYRFFQYKADGYYNITRPLNSDLMLDRETAEVAVQEFVSLLPHAADIPASDPSRRALIRRTVYTLQQTIGAALDALPAGHANNARKINGDLFERLIRLLILEMGITCRGGVINVPVMVDGATQFYMSYQHDLLLYSGEELKVIGSVKTSSKDRLDKIFIDKFLYNRLTETDLPHIVVFLGDVQRKQTRQENRYGVNSTFLSGHFRGYTVKLNPLDGVYYCDIRPNMQSDPFLKQHIRTIDCLFCDDLGDFVRGD